MKNQQPQQVIETLAEGFFMLFREGRSSKVAEYAPDGKLHERLANWNDIAEDSMPGAAFWGRRQWRELAKQFLEAAAVQMSVDDSELDRATEARCPECQGWLEGWCHTHGVVNDVIDKIEFDRDRALVLMSEWRDKYEQCNKRYEDLRKHAVERDMENQRLKKDLEEARRYKDEFSPQESPRINGPHPNRVHYDEIMKMPETIEDIIMSQDPEGKWADFGKAKPPQ